MLKADIEALEQEISIELLEIRMPNETETQLERLASKTPETITRDDLRTIRGSLGLLLKMERLFYLRQAYDKRRES